MDPVKAHVRKAKDHLEMYDPLPTSHSGIALDHVKRALDEIDRESPAPVERVDVVSGDGFAKLPKGSIGIVCDEHGKPNQDCLPIKSGSRPDPVTRPGFLYRVLYRAPIEPLKVNDKITDHNRLAHAELGTVLATGLRAYVRTANDEWELTGSSGVRRDAHIPLPATVVYVPKGENK